MWIVKHKTIFFIISAVLVLASLGIVFTKGLNPSIEFTGGTLMEVQSSGENTPLTKSEIEEIFTALAPNARVSVQSYGEEGFLIRSSFLDEETQTSLIDTLTAPTTGAEVARVSSIGPTIGSELKSKAVVAVVLVSLLTILFIAFAFRHVSEPVRSWKYGVVAIITLLHDIIIPAGLFALIGFEMDLLFVMALLAILGYSINDTIVVFDRIRENLRRNQENKVKDEVFETTVGRSLKETLSRSFNTSFTTVLVLLALYIFGPSSTNHFALTLLAGAIAGTYSSIFLASPILVWIERHQKPLMGKGEKRK